MASTGLTVIRPARSRQGTLRVLNTLNAHDSWGRSLYTSLPVVDLEGAMRAVFHYEKRWLVEGYFKALKSGCRVTERQLKTRGRLEALVGLLSIVAVRLLQLQAHARTEPGRPGEISRPGPMRMGDRPAAVACAAGWKGGGAARPGPGRRRTSPRRSTPAGPASCPMPPCGRPSPGRSRRSHTGPRRPRRPRPSPRGDRVGPGTRRTA